jgi:hypothetical protein
MSEIGTQKLKYQNPAIGNQNEEWETEIGDGNSGRIQKPKGSGASPACERINCQRCAVRFPVCEWGSGPPPQTRIGIST